MLSREQRRSIAERLRKIALHEQPDVAKEFERIADGLDPRSEPYTSAEVGSL
jgi:hypothetical protein